MDAVPVARGGMGSVQRARDPESGSLVAIKRCEIPGTGGRGRFLREAELLARLDHPGLARHVEHGDDDGIPYLVTEWIDGLTLDARLEEGPIGWEEAHALMRALVGALAHAHARGVVHRDVKPANILLAGGRLDMPVLVDFGIARAESSPTFTAVGVAIGTPGYMAPEQVRGEAGADPRTDLFGLGCVLYRAVCGRTPHDGPPVAILAKTLSDDAPDARRFVPDLPPRAAALLARLLARDPEARPRDAQAILGLLDRETTEVRPVVGATENRFATVVLVVDGEEAAAADVTEIPVGSGAGRERVRALAARHGAVYDALRGDAALLRFRAGEIAPAARCALDLARGLPGARVGVATGRMVAGAEYGEAIDRAAALVSRPGVRVDRVAARLLGPPFAVGDDGSLSIGISLASGPFVGRGRELSTLVDALDTRGDGARVAVVRGVPGMGKTRIAEEARVRLGPQRCWRVGGTAGRGLAWGMAAQILRAAAGVDDGPVRARVAADARAAGLDAEAADLVAELACVGVEAAGTSGRIALLRGDPALYARRLREAFVARVVAACPLLVVVDDLQWCDHPSVEALGAALASDPRGLRVLALARPEADPLVELLDSADLVDIRLRRLSVEASRELVGPDVSDALVEGGAGNPFYLRELAAAAARGETAVPESVVALVEARLEELDPIARQVARAASVFGRRCPVEAAQALLPDGIDIAGSLRTLAALGWIDAGGPDVAFRHDLLRDMIYGSLVAEDCRNAHLAAARWLLAHGELDAARIARHFESGGDRAAAVGRWCAAALQAMDAADVRAVAAYVERGKACGASGADLGTLQATLLDALRLHGASSEALAAGLEAVDLLPPGRRWFDVLGQTALLAAFLHRTEVLAGLAQRAAAAVAAPDVDVLLALARVLTHFPQSHPLRPVLLRQFDSVNGSVRETSPLETARANLARGLVHAVEGRPFEASEAFGACVAAFEEVGDDRNACMQAIDRAMILLAIGRWDEAEGLFRHCREAATRLGLARAAALSASFLGFIATRSGRRPPDLGALLDGALAEFVARGETFSAALALAYKAEIAVAEGRLAEADAFVEDAVARMPLDSVRRPVVLVTRARVDLAVGRAASALAWAEETMATLHPVADVAPCEWEARLVHAEALRACGLPWQGALAEARARAHEVASCLPVAVRPDFFAIPSVARIVQDWRDAGPAAPEQTR